MYVIEDTLKTITQSGKEVVTNYAYDVWKEGVVILSFTHLVGGLFIAGISPCKALEHGQNCLITGEGLRSYIQ